MNKVLCYVMLILLNYKVSDSNQLLTPLQSCQPLCGHCSISIPPNPGSTRNRSNHSFEFQQKPNKNKRFKIWVLPQDHPSVRHLTNTCCRSSRLTSINQKLSKLSFWSMSFKSGTDDGSRYAGQDFALGDHYKYNDWIEPVRGFLSFFMVM